MKSCQQTTAFTDFKTVFCEHFGCSEEEFLTELLWKSLDPVWRPIAAGLQHMWPDFFARDLAYLKRMGQARSWDEVVDLAHRIPSARSLDRSWLRETLHLRISGYRVLTVTGEITKARLAASAPGGREWAGVATQEVAARSRRTT